MSEWRGDDQLDDEFCNHGEIGQESDHPGYLTLKSCTAATWPFTTI